MARSANGRWNPPRNFEPSIELTELICICHLRTLCLGSVFLLALVSRGKILLDSLVMPVFVDWWAGCASTFPRRSCAIR